MAIFKKDVDYFDMFVKGTEFALNAARMLSDLLGHAPMSEESMMAVKLIEQDADHHMHTICEQLSSAFITPIDQDDIYRIAKETDDITDSIEAVANKLWMMNVGRITPPMQLMAEYIVNACEKLVALMSELHNHKKNNKLYDYTVEINRIEELGDKCYKEAMRVLFENEKDPIELIKTQAIYGALEEVLDDCEDVADCVESIILTKT